MLEASAQEGGPWGSAEGGCAFQLGDSLASAPPLCQRLVGREVIPGPLRADGTQGRTADGAALGPGFRQRFCWVCLRSCGWSGGAGWWSHPPTSELGFAPSHKCQSPILQEESEPQTSRHLPRADLVPRTGQV